MAWNRKEVKEELLDEMINKRIIYTLYKHYSREENIPDKAKPIIEHFIEWLPGYMRQCSFIIERKEVEN